MNQLRSEDLKAIAVQIGDYWEFNHHGMECPHNLSTDAFDGIEDEGLFELQVTSRLPREA